ncbi:MAG: hypothetical protein ABJL54_16115 [Halioglobus sp.]
MTKKYQLYRILYHVCLWPAVAVLAIGHIGVLIGQGWGAYTEMMSPFNLVNWIATMLTLAPAMIFYSLSEKQKTLPQVEG